jgi:uncharacterized protein YndB with AHSA1/START domain
MHTINNTIQINATPSTVQKALTTHEGMVGWWTTDCECNAEAREATFRFRVDSGTKSVTFKMLSADETGVVMECIRATNNMDWLGTKLSFQLVAASGGTRVELTHAGYPAKNELYDNCVKGWAYFLGSLKSYVETGKGTPHDRPAVVKAS